MGTACTVAMLKKDGSVDQVYVNYDGDIRNNGAMLLLHYREPEKVKELISFGNISTLGRKVNPTTDWHTFDKREPDVTTYYGRDRGESGQKPNKFESYADFLLVGSFDDYNYLFDEKKGKWFSFNPYNRVIKNESTMETEVEKPTPLLKLVKAVFNSLNSELKTEFLLYEKELNAEKQYKKLKKELPTKEEAPKKLKI